MGAAPVKLKKWLYLPKGYNDGLVAARIAAKTGVVRGLWFGDSITQGANATDWLVGGWASQLIAYMQGVMGNAGYYDGTYNSVEFIATFGGVQRWTFQSTPTFNTWGTARTATFVATGTTLATFTPRTALARCDLLVHRQVAGNFNWAVKDSGGATVNSGTFDNTTGGVSFTDGRLSLLSVGAVPAGGSVVITSQTVAGVAALTGANCWVNTSLGLFAANVSASGQALSDYGASTVYPADKLKMWGGTGIAGITNVDATVVDAPFAPHFAFFALGINDNLNTNQRGYDQMRFWYERVIWSLRAANANCSIIFILPYCPDLYVSDVTSTGSNYRPKAWKNIERCMRDLAAIYSCAFVDVHGYFGERALAAGWMQVNNIHPTVTGQTAFFNLVKQAV